MWFAAFLILLPRLKCIAAVSRNSFQWLRCQHTLFKTVNVASAKTLFFHSINPTITGLTTQDNKSK